MRGQANMKIGNYRGAIEAYEKAHQRNLKNTQTTRNLGMAYAKDGLFEKALGYLESYVQEEPRDAEVLYQVAEICSWKAAKGKNGECARYFKRGLAVEYRLEMHRKYARLLSREKATRGEAVAEYRKIIANQSPQTDLVQIDADRAQLRELLASDPNNRTLAAIEYRQYTKEHPGDMDAKLKYARMLEQDPNKLSEAADLLAEVSRKRSFPYDLELERARILVNVPSRQNEARLLYESFAAKRNDLKIQEELADLLARDRATIVDSQVHYAEILKQDPTNRRVRLKYGRVLLAEKAGSKAAAEQFNYILQGEPRNAEAHHGAALAYSAMGENEMALFHAKNAKVLGAETSDLSQIEVSTSKQQKSIVGPSIGFIQQSADNDYQLAYRSFGASAALHPTAFINVKPEAGFEQIADETDSFNGAYLKGTFDYLTTHKLQLHLGAALHAMGPVSRRDEWWGGIHMDMDEYHMRVTASQEYRWDSLTAVTGKNVKGNLVGAARNRLVGAGVSHKEERFTWDAEVRTGSVISGSGEVNGVVDGRAYTEYAFESAPTFQPGLAYRLDLPHYSDDFSGFAEPIKTGPHSGGYFSPDLFLSQALLALLVKEIKDDYFFKTALGPNVQFIRLFDGPQKLTLGIEGYTNVTRKIKSSEWDISGNISYFKLPDVNFRIYYELNNSSD